MPRLISHTTSTETAEEAREAKRERILNDPDRILIGLAELAVLRRISVDTAKRRRHLGQLPRPRIEERDSADRPHEVLWLRDHVVAWIEAGAPTSPTELEEFDDAWYRRRKARA
jgi:hypothetical protein